MHKERHALGIDLGGTKIAIGIVEASGHVVDSLFLATEVAKGPGGIETQILEASNSLIQKVGVSISCIGIGVPGQIDVFSQRVICAPNLNWQNVDLKTNIEKKIKIPTMILNDVRAIALGEWKFGAGQDSQDMLAVFVGTGIGGALIHNGCLLSGHSNTFAEIGHMSIDYRGPLCNCGKRGCFEVFAGGLGLARRAQEMILKEASGLGKKLYESVNGDVGKISARVIIEAYKNGDPLAETLVLELQEALTAGLVNLIHVYNPQTLILGGGIIEGLPEMIKILEEKIKAQALKAATAALKIKSAQLGKKAGIIGAAAYSFLEHTNE